MSIVWPEVEPEDFYYEDWDYDYEDDETEDCD